MKPVMSFDCYGTLIDWEEGIWNTINKILARKGINKRRESILSLYAQIELRAEKEYKPYKEILKEVMDEFGRVLGIELEEEGYALVKSIPHWPAFPDAKDALMRIKEDFRITIISNVDNDIIEETIKNLGVDFDFIITAEMAKAYKPDLRVFKYAKDIMQVDKSNWFHTAQSIYHDIIPAKKLGVKTVWIKRRGFGATPPANAKADFNFLSLEDLANNIGSLK
ncbi:haloacid dehalogenase, type II [Aciduliprofundum boonei T469]|nr:haloacid dehalogenase, type II [Aciduliprofundum boonei T469]